ncbi:MAG: hypothetical protein JO305_04480 [Alphaproteobacteria bacterium]|nr:hypothetical protein [Alphaproteobacteria bacterium]
MRKRPLAGLLWGAASALGIAACADRGEGFVELRPVAGRAALQEPLYLGAVKLDLSGGRRLVLRLPVGTVALSDGGFGPFATKYCEIVVRKDRVSTVFVRAWEQPPRCQCDIPSNSGGGQLPSCM